MDIIQYNAVHKFVGVLDNPQRPKCKDKYFDSKPRALCKSARELPHFSNSTMSEAKEATIREDE